MRKELELWYREQSQLSYWVLWRILDNLLIEVWRQYQTQWKCWWELRKVWKPMFLPNFSPCIYSRQLIWGKSLPWRCTSSGKSLTNKVKWGIKSTHLLLYRECHWFSIVELTDLYCFHLTLFEGNSYQTFFHLFLNRKMMKHLILSLASSWEKSALAKAGTVFHCSFHFLS